MGHAKSNDPNVFLLPDLGEGLAEAELIKWRVTVGQFVGELEVLAEMETDKALVEVTSPRSGTIAELHGEPGEVIKVGAPLVVYGGANAASKKAAATSETKPASKPEPKADNKPARPADNGQKAQGNLMDHVPEPTERTEDAGTVVGDMSGGLAGMSAAPGKALATPAVRRLAKDLGIDIDSVTGSGIGGRVLEKDVRSSGAASVKAAASPVSYSQPAAAPRSAATTSTAPASRPSSPAPAARVAIPDGEDSIRIPFRGVRRVIANRLRESMNQAVHFTVMDEADVSALDSLRKRLAGASGEKVSFLPFVCSAMCRVLGDSRFRTLNATVDEKPGDAAYEASIVQHRSVHLGIATDTDSGLMVPVIRDADRLGVLEIGRAINAIAEGARSRTIAREQLSGSTFTISNVGSHAGRFATPVINYPEAGIIAVGRAREGMVVSKGTFRVGLLLPLSLACDHRVVDGATAALALAEVIQLLQNPEQLLTPARG